MPKLDPDKIVANIMLFIDGATRMANALQGAVDGAAEHHAHLHEFAPADAQRIRAADTRMAEALELLAENAGEAAGYVREALESSAEN